MWGIQNNLKVRGSARVSQPRGSANKKSNQTRFAAAVFKALDALKFGMGFLGGLIFGSGIFWGFVGSPSDFGGFWFCLHSIIPVTSNPEYHPHRPLPQPSPWG